MEQEQFKKEVLPLRPKILNYARSILENAEDAEDITQEVFFKLWTMHNDLEQYDSIAALSIVITKNLSINYIRKRQKKQDISLEGNFVDKGPSPHIVLEQKDDVERVMKIIDVLPDMQQTILKMKHVEGLENEEIAQLTGSSAEAIRVNISRARKRIRDLFFEK